MIAEQEAREKKRKADGLPALSVEDKPAAQDDEASKRRKLLQEALELDKDDDDDADDDKNGAGDKNGDKSEQEDEFVTYSHLYFLSETCVVLSKGRII